MVTNVDDGDSSKWFGLYNAAKFSRLGNLTLCLQPRFHLARFRLWRALHALLVHPPHPLRLWQLPVAGRLFSAGAAPPTAASFNIPSGANSARPASRCCGLFCMGSSLGVAAAQLRPPLPRSSTRAAPLAAQLHDPAVFAPAWPAVPTAPPSRASLPASAACCGRCFLAGLGRAGQACPLSPSRLFSQHHHGLQRDAAPPLN
ncbi:hypothetical protein L7F22_017704 [Adiantum nelumboides]|nr:hypothetical protein [Adiantum nelumboides]